MKPTQEQILRALNKLIRENKTKLKTQKVKLATIRSIVKYRGAIADDYLKASGIASNAGDQVEAILKNVILKAKTNLESIAKAKQQVKDLGIDTPKELLDAETSAKEYIKRAENNIKTVLLFQKFNG